jgi:hypothetical protein
VRLKVVMRAVMIPNRMNLSPLLLSQPRVFCTLSSMIPLLEESDLLLKPILVLLPLTRLALF